jgi:hypothetical protein
VVSAVLWASIGLGVILVINLAIFVILGIWDLFRLLIAMSDITFFEAGLFLVIGGIALMIGGFPSISRAIYDEYDPEKAKATQELSYAPLLLAGFLLLISIVTSLGI